MSDDKMFDRLAAGIILAWIVGGLASIAGTVALAWVAWHFLAKVW